VRRELQAILLVSFGSGVEEGPATASERSIARPQMVETRIELTLSNH
jgi:hypothetical protein